MILIFRKIIRIQFPSMYFSREIHRKYAHNASRYIEQQINTLGQTLPFLSIFLAPLSLSPTFPPPRFFIIPRRV